MSLLTISVVSHGHRHHLQALLSDLDSLAAQGADLRLVVTLNVPEPPPTAAAYPHLHLTVLQNASPKGFGANHNAAFAHCETPWFAVLNPDLRLATDPFPQLLAAAEGSLDMGVISPAVVAADGRPEDHVRVNLSPLSLIRRRRGTDEVVDTTQPARKPGPFYWLAGMFLLFSREAYSRVGGFDERFFLYCEDYDICARLFGAGYAMQVVPGVQVVHNAQRDSHRSARHLRWHLSSLFKVWCSAAFWRVACKA